MPNKPVRVTSRASSAQEPVSTQDDISRRLRRIEGQVRGIQRMIDEGRACRDVLDQLAAIQQAVRGVSSIVAQKYALECIESVQENDTAAQTRETAAALVDTILRAPR